MNVLSPPPPPAHFSLRLASCCLFVQLLNAAADIRDATRHSRRPCNSKASRSLWSGCVCVRSKPCHLMLLCCGTAIGDAWRKFDGCCCSFCFFGGEVLFYVHRNHKAYVGTKNGEPRMATSTLTQLLSSACRKDRSSPESCGVKHCCSQSQCRLTHWWFARGSPIDDFRK